MKFLSQKNQDRWVINDVYKGRPNTGFFVDLASAEGVHWNNTYLLEKEYGWSGICIEPNPDFFKQLVKNRKCITENSVVSDNYDPVVFRYDNKMLGGIVASDTDNGKQNRLKERQKIFESKPKTLNDILLFHNAPKRINYLSLDVEGSEERVLSSLDFSIYSFDCLTVERPTVKCNEILFDNNYLFVKNDAFDTFYINKDFYKDSGVTIEKFQQVPIKNI